MGTSGFVQGWIPISSLRGEYPGLEVCLQELDSCFLTHPRPSSARLWSHTASWGHMRALAPAASTTCPLGAFRREDNDEVGLKRVLVKRELAHEKLTINTCSQQKQYCSREVTYKRIVITTFQPTRNFESGWDAYSKSVGMGWRAIHARALLCRVKRLEASINLCPSTTCRSKKTIQHEISPLVHNKN